MLLRNLGINFPSQRRIRGPSASSDGSNNDSSHHPDYSVSAHSGNASNSSPARRRLSKRLRRNGATTVEMALVTPFILFLIFMSVEFSRMMMIKQSLTNAAREGCRHCSLATMQDPDDADDLVRHRLRGVVSNHQNENVVRVSVSPTFSGSLDSGTEIVTTVEVSCADVSWFPTVLFAGAKIRGVASMKRE